MLIHTAVAGFRRCLKSISAEKLECGLDVHTGTLCNSRGSVRQTITGAMRHVLDAAPCRVLRKEEGA